MTRRSLASAAALAVLQPLAGVAQEFTVLADPPFITRIDAPAGTVDSSALRTGDVPGPYWPLFGPMVNAAAPNVGPPRASLAAGSVLDHLLKSRAASPREPAHAVLFRKGAGLITGPLGPGSACLLSGYRHPDTPRVLTFLDDDLAPIAALLGAYNAQDRNAMSAVYRYLAKVFDDGLPDERSAPSYPAWEPLGGPEKAARRLHLARLAEQRAYPRLDRLLIAAHIANDESGKDSVLNALASRFDARDAAFLAYVVERYVSGTFDPAVCKAIASWRTQKGSARRQARDLLRRMAKRGINDKARRFATAGGP